MTKTVYSRRVAVATVLAALMVSIAATSLLIVLGGGHGVQRPSTASLLSTACAEVDHYDQNAVVREASGLPAGYAACAAPGERPVVDSWRILKSDPGAGYTVSLQ